MIDEVQALPLEVTSLFNLTLNFLSRIMNANIVLCTATQPTYDSENIPHKVRYGGLNNENTDLIVLSEEESSAFKRTTVYKFSENNQVSTLEEVAMEVDSHPDESILIILNTKKAVKELFKLISSTTNRHCYHLSTNMCAKHRLDIIKEIKSKINNEPLICISTQLVEAGVDLDFNRVIRSFAGIDSIVQASGRCNREGKLKTGIVQLVNIDSSQENISRLKSIKKKKQTTEQIVANLNSPIDIDKLNDEFFERYYSNSKKFEFDYPTEKDGSTVYDMLSLNRDGIQPERGALKQAFKTAGLKMDLIQSDTSGAIVYYDNNHEKVERLIQACQNFENSYQVEDLIKIRQLTKELQQYTINLWKTDSLNASVLNYLNGSIRILQETMYSLELGANETIEGFIY